uniref:Nitrite reductase n=1 Tax=Parastrongyloides trichosuri TaxID=131310 RepID=A0A0N4ZWA5_PARTI
VAGAQAEAGAVAQGIAHGDALADHRVRQGEAGQIGLDRLVPLHLALVDQDGQAGGGDVLGVRRDGEQGVLIDRLGLALAAHAVTLGQHRLAVADQGQRHGGLLRPGGHAALHPGVGGGGDLLVGACIGAGLGPAGRRQGRARGGDGGRNQRRTARQADGHQERSRRLSGDATAARLRGQGG